MITHRLDNFLGGFISQAKEYWLVFLLAAFIFVITNLLSMAVRKKPFSAGLDVGKFRSDRLGLASGFLSSLPRIHY